MSPVLWSYSHTATIVVGDGVGDGEAVGEGVGLGVGLIVGVAVGSTVATAASEVVGAMLGVGPQAAQMVATSSASTWRDVRLP
jgi:hypothetical protein